MQHSPTTLIWTVEYMYQNGSKFGKSRPQIKPDGALLYVPGTQPKEVVFPGHTLGRPWPNLLPQRKTAPSCDIEVSGPVSTLMGKLSRPLYSPLGQTEK